MSLKAFIHREPDQAGPYLHLMRLHYTAERHQEVADLFGARPDLGFDGVSGPPAIARMEALQNICRGTGVYEARLAYLYVDAFQYDDGQAMAEEGLAAIVSISPVCSPV